MMPTLVFGGAVRTYRVQEVDQLVMHQPGYNDLTLSNDCFEYVLNTEVIPRAVWDLALQTTPVAPLQLTLSNVYTRDYGSAPPLTLRTCLQTVNPLYIIMLDTRHDARGQPITALRGPAATSARYVVDVGDLSVGLTASSESSTMPDIYARNWRCGVGVCLVVSANTQPTFHLRL